MHTFIYQGWNTQGERVRSSIRAPYAWFAKHELLSQGIFVYRLRRSFFNPTPISATQLLFITEQLAVLCNAHLPIVFCLQTLAKQLKPSLSVLFLQMIRMIEHGKSLSVALSYFPHIFPSYFVHLIAVGESSGQLNAVLLQLSQYQEKNLMYQKQIKKALLYPVSVLSISCIIIMGLLIFIVPQFQILFKDMQTNLPIMTTFVFILSDFLRGITFFTMILIASIVIVIYKFLYRYQYYLPILGPLLRTHQQIRYLHSLGSALKAGLPLLKSLELAAQIMLPALPQTVQNGISLKQALDDAGQFPTFVIQLVTIGEQTGQLPQLLLESVAILTGRIEKQMAYVTQLLQPIFITVLGVILGGLIIALYLPIFKLGALY